MIRTIPSGRLAAADSGWSARSPRSTTGEEGRPRWGDRGVATGRLWEPTAPNERLPQVRFGQIDLGQVVVTRVSLTRVLYE